MKKNLKNIKKIISSKEMKKGVEKYCEVLELYRKSKDISKDRFFQRKFNGFFRVRKNKGWQKIFYIFFENNRNNINLNFEDVFKYIYKKIGRKEISFSSKLLHLVKPDMPIYDSVVCNNLNLNYNPSDLTACFEKYEKILKWYRNFLKSEESKKWIEEFNLVFPDFKNEISDIKKIDFILWQIR